MTKETEKIAGLKKKRFEKYTSLCEISDRGNKVWFVVEGEVAVICRNIRGEDRTVFIAEKGDLVGEEVIFLGRYRFAAVTLTEALLISIDSEAFLELLRRENSFVRGVGFRLVGKILRLINDLTLKSVSASEATSALERLQVGLGRRDELIRSQDLEIKTLQEFLLSMTMTAADVKLQREGITVVGTRESDKFKED